MLLFSIGCVLIIMLISSCSADLPIQREAQVAEGSMSQKVQYSIVCVIHGDSDYLYHDTSGIERKADEEALAEVKRIAQQNPQAEVFIFHQRPRRHFLFFFPLRDGEFYYYRKGRLIANELYWRNQEHSYLDPEVELYRRFRTDNQSKMFSIFLYCGHEIPEYGGTGYDASYPDRIFTVNDLIIGLKDLRNDYSKFDLMILSTCFGGTPYTIGGLGQFTRFIIASPDNLHLSYFDIHSLERLDLSLKDRDLHAFAKRFALHSFEKLTKNIKTAVSVAVYDVDQIQKFLHSVHSVYDNTLISLKKEPQTFMLQNEHCDCADIPSYIIPSIKEGIDIFYRPSVFGRLKDKQYHSGWECWKNMKPEDMSIRTTEP
jgi:hypothetical protein